MNESHVKLNAALYRLVAKTFTDNNISISLTEEFICNCWSFLDPNLSISKRLNWINNNVPITDSKKKNKFLDVTQKYYTATTNFLEEILKEDPSVLFFDIDKITDKLVKYDLLLLQVNYTILQQLGIGITSLVSNMLGLADEEDDFMKLLNNAERNVDKLFSIMLSNINILPYELSSNTAIEPQKLSLFLKSIITVIYYTKKKLNIEEILTWETPFSGNVYDIHNSVH